MALKGKESVMAKAHTHHWVLPMRPQKRKGVEEGRPHFLGKCLGCTLVKHFPVLRFLKETSKALYGKWEPVEAQVYQELKSVATIG